MLLDMIDSVSSDVGPASVDLKKSRPARAAMGRPVVDRLPPHSEEAERGVLGCVLLAPREGMGVCIEKFKRGSEVFYDIRHQTMFDVLSEMYDQKEAIDAITLQQRLKDRNQLEGIGGLSYLAALVDAVPSAANLEYYLDIVR